MDERFKWLYFFTTKVKKKINQNEHGFCMFVTFLTYCTVGMRITNISWRTSACCSVVDHVALSTRGTVARVLTSLVLTGEVWRTLGISQTLGSVAADLRVTVVLRQALTASTSPSIHMTLGVDSTLRVGTRVHTLTVDTSLCRWTLWVTSTPNCYITEKYCWTSR